MLISFKLDDGVLAPGRENVKLSGDSRGDIQRVCVRVEERPSGTY